MQAGIFYYESACFSNSIFKPPVIIYAFTTFPVPSVINSTCLSVPSL